MLEALSEIVPVVELCNKCSDVLSALPKKLCRSENKLNKQRLSCLKQIINLPRFTSLGQFQIYFAEESKSSVMFPRSEKSTSAAVHLSAEDASRVPTRTDAVRQYPWQHAHFAPRRQENGSS
jgi:hypothetical protein